MFAGTVPPAGGAAAEEISSKQLSKRLKGRHLSPAWGKDGCDNDQPFYYRAHPVEAYLCLSI
jgi:hypothetical protein